MRRQTGFTLIELLIVIAVILVIAAIVAPSLTQAPPDAAQCAGFAALQ